MWKYPWLDITTKLPCDNNCSYCPQKLLKESYKGDLLLTLEVFNKILDNTPNNVSIYFAGFGEPFLNQDATEMILIAHRRGYKIGLWTTLVGLTESQAIQLNDIPFVWVHVHDIGQKKRDYKWINDWSKPVVNSRGGNLWEEGRRGTGKCGKSPDFTTNVALPNGDVVLCCSDYGLKHPLGNLLTTNFNDLKRDSEYELCYYCQYAL